MKSFGPVFFVRSLKITNSGSLTDTWQFIWFYSASFRACFLFFQKFTNFIDLSNLLKLFALSPYSLFNVSELSGDILVFIFDVGNLGVKGRKHRFKPGTRVLELTSLILKPFHLALN